MKEKFGIVPEKIIEDKRLNSYAVLLYAAFALYADDKGQCYPTTEQLMAKTRLCKNSFYKHKQLLIDCNYVVETKRRTEDGRFERNVYFLPLNKR